MSGRSWITAAAHLSSAYLPRLTSGVVLALLLPFPLAAQTVVRGEDDPLLDLPAVQAAVDQGGRVRLLGTFDFGEAGRVLISNDVDIRGEADRSGTPLTIIRGGEWDFFTPYPSPDPTKEGPAKAGPRIAIHHLHFIGSRGTAVHLAYSGGALVHHNVIEAMRARRPSGATTTERAAVVIGPALLGGPANTTFVPLLVSGDIRVTDNELDVSVSGIDEPTSLTRGMGMFVSMYVGADVRIERNRVTGNTRTGLAIRDGKTDVNGRGSVVIADNQVLSDVVSGFTLPTAPRAPIGIVTGFNNNRALGQDPDLQSTTDRFSTSGEILATTSHQALLHNRIIGEGCNAIRFGGTADGQERRENVAIGNNVSRFHAFEGGFAKCADYWLEPASQDNTVVGHSGTTIDEGMDNKVTGLTPVPGGVGGEVSDAEQDAHEVEWLFE